MTDSNGILKRRDRGRFTKGTAPGPGRRKGTPNRTTVDLRIIRDEIAESWRRGNGPKLLDQLARDDYPRYLELVCKVLPRAVELRDEKAAPRIVVNMIAETQRPPMLGCDAPPTEQARRS